MKSKKIISSLLACSMLLSLAACAHRRMILLQRAAHLNQRPLLKHLPRLQRTTRIRFLPQGLTENQADIFPVFIRLDWLKALNLEVPKTTEDLKKAAIAFTKSDPDKNGKADTYGLAVAAQSSLLTDWGDYDKYMDYEATKNPENCGIWNGGAFYTTWNMNIPADVKNNVYRATPTDEMTGKIEILRKMEQNRR